MAGLIAIGERKSIQPMAQRDGVVGNDQLHHFVGAGVWDAAPLEWKLARQADAILGGDKAFLPESWTGDEARLSRVGAPERRRIYRTKPEIAIDEIDRLRAAGVRFGCVLTV